jgi:hypothetical protein
MCDAGDYGTGGTDSPRAADVDSGSVSDRIHGSSPQTGQAPPGEGRHAIAEVLEDAATALRAALATPEAP